MEDEVGESGTVDHLLVIGDADGDTVGAGSELENVSKSCNSPKTVSTLVKYIERLFDLVNAREKEQKNFCCD